MCFQLQSNSLFISEKLQNSFAADIGLACKNNILRRIDETAHINFYEAVVKIMISVKTCNS